ncbi:MAG: ABC transporter permease [Hyphomicrobiaceae bacterium]|nr:ABC transporter permease [Hyphomicrobiaceae bacterium]
MTMETGRQRLWREFKRSRLAQFGAGILVLLVIMVLFGPEIAPHDPEKFNLRLRNMGPAFLGDGNWSYLFGTDSHGRDVLSRIIYGARISLGTAASGVSIAVIIGVTLGMIAGYFGGVLDTVIMRFVDILLSIPLILMALLVVAIFGPKLINVIMVMGAVGWIWHARIVRGNVLRIREEQYVLAAVNLGTTNTGIMFRHVLPNLLAPVLVTATMQMGYMVILESGLSFFGISGSTLSWGWDISVGRKYLGTAWWIASFPGFAIFFTVLSFNLLGDFLRDVIDPHSRHTPVG